jgi:hypothetical protein
MNVCFNHMMPGNLKYFALVALVLIYMPLIS